MSVHGVNVKGSNELLKVVGRPLQKGWGDTESKILTIITKRAKQFTTLLCILLREEMGDAFPYSFGARLATVLEDMGKRATLAERELGDLIGLSGLWLS